MIDDKKFIEWAKRELSWQRRERNGTPAKNSSLRAYHSGAIWVYRSVIRHIQYEARHLKKEIQK